MSWTKFQVVLVLPLLLPLFLLLLPLFLLLLPLLWNAAMNLQVQCTWVRCDIGTIWLIAQSKLLSRFLGSPLFKQIMSPFFGGSHGTNVMFGHLIRSRVCCLQLIVVDLYEPGGWQRRDNLAWTKAGFPLVAVRVNAWAIILRSRWAATFGTNQHFALAMVCYATCRLKLSIYNVQLVAALKGLIRMPESADAAAGSCLKHMIASLIR